MTTLYRIACWLVGLRAVLMVRSSRQAAPRSRPALRIVCIDDDELGQPSTSFAACPKDLRRWYGELDLRDRVDAFRDN